METDTSLINTYLLASSNHWSGNPDSSYYYAFKAYNLATRSTRIDLIATSNRYLGISYMIKGETELANLYLSKAIEYYTQIGDEQGIASVLNNFGNIKTKKGELSEALDYFFKALQLREEVGDIVEIASTISNIGHIYLYYGESSEAAKWFRRGLNHLSGHNFKAWEAIMYDNLGAAYVTMGQPDSAVVFLTQAYEDSKSENFNRIQGSSAVNLGQLYLKQNQLDLAQKYIQEGFDRFHMVGFTAGIIKSKLAMAELKLINKLPEEASENALAALQIANETNNETLKLQIYQLLQHIYAEKGDFESAYNYGLTYQGKREMVFNNYQQSHFLSIKMMRQEMENNRQEVENENNYLVSRNVLILLIILFFTFFIGIVAIIASRQRKIKYLKNELRHTKQILEDIPSSILTDENIRTKTIEDPDRVRIFKIYK